MPSTSLEETDAAIERAQEAFAGWRAVAPGERARLLRSFAAVVDAHVEELARLEVRNAGHTIGNARWEAGNVRDCLNYYSAAPERLFGRQIPVPGGLDVTFHEPLGVVSVIVPWNFPMPIAGLGLRPRPGRGQHRGPEARGADPADRDPPRRARGRGRAADRRPHRAARQGLGRRRSASSRTRWSARCASPAPPTSGKQIMAGCADQVKRVTLELGGKSANIVFADTDVAAAAAAAPGAAFDNTGQDCCARSRILVERPAYDEFVGRLEEAVTAMRVADPARRGHRDGAAGVGGAARRGAGVRRRRDRRLRRQRPRRTRLVAAADGGRVAGHRGAGLARGGVRSGGRGDALRRPRRRPSRSPTTRSTACPGRSSPPTSAAALRVARGVEAGNLSVNSHSSVRYWTPFGGYKQSGLGRELGPDAPQAFTEEKNVFIAH